jgi:hypothetical protein
MRTLPFASTSRCTKGLRLVVQRAGGFNLEILRRRSARAPSLRFSGHSEESAPVPIAAELSMFWQSNRVKTYFQCFMPKDIFSLVFEEYCGFEVVG